MDECTEALEQIKFKKNICWVSYKITDDKKSIVVGTKKEKDDWGTGKDGYERFVKEELDVKTPRYYVYSFSYTLPDGGERDKLVFIPW